MKLSGVERRMLASVMAAGAAMLLCFALRSTGMTVPDSLPRTPPAAAAEGREGSTASETIVPDARVNVNTAGAEELMTLPGIGQARAQAILDDRAANGPYRWPEELIRVKGIGEGTLAGLLDQITTGGS